MQGEGEDVLWEREDQTKTALSSTSPFSSLLTFPKSFIQREKGRSWSCSDLNAEQFLGDGSAQKCRNAPNCWQPFLLWTLEGENTPLHLAHHPKSIFQTFFHIFFFWVQSLDKLPAILFPPLTFIKRWHLRQKIRRCVANLYHWADGPLFLK